MILELKRYTSDEDSSGGLLSVEGKFFGYTCEDEKREIKVPGETRIPAGIYAIKLRAEGGMTKRYATKYDFHQGMLHLQDVPGFKYIYIHVGNTDDHTEGCILVGYGANRVDGETQVSRSRDAYTDLYKAILSAMAAGEEVQIIITEGI